MRIGHVIGTVVATVKSPELNSTKLLLIALSSPEQPTKDEADTTVAVDLVGAGEGEVVLVTLGSSARKVAGEASPTDAAVVAIVDTIRTGSRISYSKT